jgi:transposase
MRFVKFEKTNFKFSSVVRSKMCIACGEMTYKPGVGCSNCGYVGD